MFVQWTSWVVDNHSSEKLEEGSEYMAIENDHIIKVINNTAISFV